MVNILDYNAALANYNKGGSIGPVNSVISAFGAIPGNQVGALPQFAQSGQQISPAPPAPSIPTDKGGYKGSGMDQGAYDLAQARAQEAARKADPAYQANQQKQQDEYNNSINDAYAPALQYLQGLIPQVQANADTNKANTETRFGNYLQDVTDYGIQGNKTLDTGQYNLDQSNRSAYDLALNAYQALAQQRNARFGSGSSAGGAVGELAARAFADAQGKLGVAGTAAQQQIEQQRSQLGQYVQSQFAKLKSDKEDAITQINQELQQVLGNIQSNQYTTEQQKTKDKLAALQQTRAMAQQIEQSDRQFQQTIQLYAARGPQGQYAYTPPTMAYNNMSAQGPGFTSGANVGGTTDINNFSGSTGNNYSKDAYGNTIDQYGNIVTG